jgi:hypothetical protein
MKTTPSGEHPAQPKPAPSASTLARRLNRIIAGVALDCDCRLRVSDALERFAMQERDRQDRRNLMQARQHRSAIAGLIDLLAELEEIDWHESDRSVFGELAGIFDDIAHEASLGAATMRVISSAET